MFSLHVKATMMKVSHPIVFGHCVKIFYREAFEKHAKLFDELGVNVNNGMVDLYNKIATLPQSTQDEIRRDLHACHENRPELAMVDSAKGITNFHSPNDVIVDASMPAMIRNGGKMYGADGRLKDVKAVMPESTFARIYQEMINFCKWHGAFDPKTMGTVPNVGLMAQQAEEYGSHDKTFEITEDGVANITDLDTGEVLLSQNVEAGDIWRMCQVKDAAIRDWVKLAVTRARNSGMPVVFWLDAYRPHEAQLITKVKMYLHEHDTTGLDIQIMSQVRAMRYTLERVIRGLDTISVTGNILRDYLTDLFPIMELGTSAKMLSIVPLMAGGGMYETGAGGSAPKHVQQLVEENHLRWDSLGEFLALAVSLEDLGIKNNNAKAKMLARTLDCRHRQAAGQQQGSLAQDRPARQPRQPLLPGAVLGPGPGRADRGQGTGRPLQAAGRGAGRQRAEDRGRTGRRARQAGRHRRLLPAGRGQDRSGDATQRDASTRRWRQRWVEVSPPRPRCPLALVARRGQLEIPPAPGGHGHVRSGSAGRRDGGLHEFLARLLRRRPGAGGPARLRRHRGLRRGRPARRQLHPDRRRLGRQHERPGRAAAGHGVDGAAAAAGLADGAVSRLRRHVRRRRGHALHAGAGGPHAPGLSFRAGGRQHPAGADRHRCCCAARCGSSGAA